MLDSRRWILDDSGAAAQRNGRKGKGFDKLLFSTHPLAPLKGELSADRLTEGFLMASWNPFVTASPCHRKLLEEQLFPFSGEARVLCYSLTR